MSSVVVLSECYNIDDSCTELQQKLDTLTLSKMRSLTKYNQVESGWT